MRKGRIFFLDLLVVFVISIILILSAVILVRNWNYILVENTVGRLADSLALDISENLINSPGCEDVHCAELWRGGEEVAIPGLAALKGGDMVWNYVLDRNKIDAIEGKGAEAAELFRNFVPDELAGRNVSYYISVREMGGEEKVLVAQSAEPEIRASVVRRLVMIEDGGSMVNGLLEVRVIV